MSMEGEVTLYDGADVSERIDCALVTFAALSDAINRGRLAQWSRWGRGFNYPMLIFGLVVSWGVMATGRSLQCRNADWH